jgi:NAD(P)-dependent dehydrogenase (short-subunit alcohol dehydrogenase family)
LRFAAQGAAVVVSDINEAGGHDTVDAIEQRGGQAAFCRTDIADEAQVRSLIDYTEKTFGRLSVLVNNASAPHPTAEGIAGWASTLQTDLLGTLHATRYAVEAMRRARGGSIVSIASISALWHGRITPGGIPGYDVAKLGVIRMTTGLAKELAKDGIRLNCLAPGWIATDGPRQYWESLSPEERLERGIPSKLLAVNDVAGMVFRMATDATLNGRVVVWWSESEPRLINWGDRGYQEFGGLAPYHNRASIR